MLISDRSDRSDLVDILRPFGDVATVMTSDIPDSPAGICGVVVEMDLRNAINVQQVRDRILGKAYQSMPRLFVLNEALHHCAMQAWALGATDTIVRPFDARGLQQRIRSAFPNTPEDDATAKGRALSKGVAAANLVLAKIFERLPLGIPLTFDDVMQAEAQILKAIKRSSLREWLQMVGRHHNASYRHCLSVTGYAVAFAQHMGMRDADQRRLTRAALLHDVGKAFIPVAILDKPAALTDEERAVMRTHPQRGYDSLAAQGSFPPEMLDVVLHHHEYLDGSGYPHGLAGDAISDIVRIITIVDIHSALTENRPYRAPFTPAKAFATMEAMTDQLDKHLLQAFRPVALGM
ncbi:MAG: response regulator receiver (CheY-like) modulated metal dependent phosphohydrolase [Tardiphaga sp.]|jgi:putative nucleotidyltransferase with HDIG domain|nr:response regulator receiver (CheY-like) modulated metal dependent phosphohydrolase [Tardiphaga sp.]